MASPTADLNEEDYYRITGFLWNEVMARCWSEDVLRSCRRLIEDVEDELHATLETKRERELYGEEGQANG